MKTTKNITLSIPQDLFDDKKLRSEIYAIYGRSGISGMLVDALRRIKEKGKL